MGDFEGLFLVAENKNFLVETLIVGDFEGKRNGDDKKKREEKEKRRGF